VFEGHEDQVYSIAISTGGGLVASTGLSDQSLRLWDLNSGECLQIIKNEEYSAFVSVAFSPDGRYLLGGTANPQFAIYVYRLAMAMGALTPEIAVNPQS